MSRDRRSSPFRAGVLLAALAIWSASPTPGLAADVRDNAPVTLSGGALPQFQSTAIGDFGLFRYDATAVAYVAIPFQIDERVDHVFPPDLEDGFTELMYDVFQEDDGLLDGDDELAFMVKDAGPRAPIGVAAPAGAGTLYYEIRVFDPRAGAPQPERWVYLFAGTGLALSPDNYVSWNLSETGSISGDVFAMDYTGNWLLTGLRVPGCAGGGDLIDRVKLRAGLAPNQAESEELWNSTSSYLGGILGPVRAIRYVRGAASGVNTIHHDVFYRTLWQRTVNLRVHAVSAIWQYIDWLPRAGLTLYTPSRPAGVAQDGVVDGPIYSSPLDEWHLMRSPAGGGIMQYDIPPSPFYVGLEDYLRDDAAYADDPGGPTAYPDEDDSAYGNHGYRMTQLTGSATELINLGFKLWPLCADEGDAALGDDYQRLEDEPLLVQASSLGAEVGPMQSLRVRRDAADVVLSWLPSVNASSYRVYTWPTPEMPRGLWASIADVATEEFRDVGAASGPDRHYFVAAVSPTPAELVDLSLTKSAGTGTPQVGSDVTFTLELSNAPGVADAGDVQVGDVLPDGYGFTSLDGPVHTLAVRPDGGDVVLDWQPAAGTTSYRVYGIAAPDLPKASWTLLGSGTGTTFRDTGALTGPDRYYLVYANQDYDPGTGTWTVGDLPAGETARLEITATVRGNGNYLNHAEVMAANYPDLDDTFGDGAGNDHDTALTSPTAAIDLSLMKVVDVANPAVGNGVTFTLDTCNASGFSTATGVVVSDPLPSGYGYLSDDGGGAYDQATGLWTIGTLAAAGCQTLEMTAQVKPAGDYANVAELTAADQPDPDSVPDNGAVAEDDRASALTTPIATVDLSLSKTVDNTAPSVGADVVFTIAVQNAAGRSDAGGVEITDLLPDGYAFTVADGPVNTLLARRDGSDVVLDWQSEIGAASYRVYGLVSPDLPRSSWPLPTNVAGTTFRDAGTVPGPDIFYLVQSVQDYDAPTGVWTIGSLPAGTGAALEIGATVLAGGDHLNTAEVTAADQPDANDTFGDGAGDDFDSAATAPQ